MRSQLWQPGTWSPRDAMPSMSQMLRDQIGAVVATETQDEMLVRYRAQLDSEQAPSA